VFVVKATACYNDGPRTPRPASLHVVPEPLAYKVSLYCRCTLEWYFQFRVYDYLWCVRQGSVLSPLLFNHNVDDVDDLIVQLPSSGLGCYIGNNFLGCVMYADDLLVLSASVGGLQSMLDCCCTYGQANYGVWAYNIQFK